MVTDAQYAAWLVDPTAIRITLVELGVNSGGVEITRYLSTDGYTTSATDTPANTSYSPCVTVGIKVTEALPISGSARFSIADIELLNLAGERDSWFSDVWVNRSAKAWIGDPRWARSDFRLVFSGLINDIDSRKRDRINIRLRDKLQQLNTPISDVKLGGTTPNKDQVLPLAFGELHNVSPLLTNPVTLEYQVHNGPVESIFEVRDNGVPVTATINNATGKFTLAKTPAGQITVSMQGDKLAGIYYNTIAKIIQRLATGYGKTTTRLTNADIDLTNFNAFDAAHPQPIGFYADARANLFQSMQQLADSVGAQVVMSRLGLLQLQQINLPPVGTPTIIKQSQQLDRTIEISNRTAVYAAVKLGYCKNWTMQPGLQTIIPAQHKDLYNTEYLTFTATDTTVQANYKLTLEPVQQNGLLMVGSDAAIEAARQLNIYKVTRTSYHFEMIAVGLLLVLGQTVTLYSNRFGLSAGVSGQVVALTPDWQTGHVIVEVIV